jgi:hypothetical protein
VTSVQKVLLAFLLLAPLQLSAQAWTPFLDSTRAIDWSSSGFTIPSYSVACATQLTGGNALVSGSGAAAGNATKIVTALTSCDATHNVVNIPAGTWYISGLTFPAHGKQVLRGAGPTLTKLISTSEAGCEGFTAGICMIDASPVYTGSAEVLPGGTQQCLWTAGYTQGATSITLSTCGGTPPNGGLLMLDQADDSSDTGGVYVCDETTPASCNYDGTGGSVGRIISGKTHSNVQIVHVTGVTGSGPYTVTFTPGIYSTNIRSGQSPGAWWPSITQLNGIENLSVDGSADGFATVGMYDCYQCWAKNVTLLNGARDSIYFRQSAFDVVQDSYFYQAQGHASVSYNIEPSLASGILVVNNIMQQTTEPIMLNGCTGCVFAYNFGVDQIAFPNFTWGAFSGHSAGNTMNLWEGNNFPWIQADDAWGSTTQATLYRNFLRGWELGRTQASTPVINRSYNRVFNIVGNVLGQPGYHTGYQTIATSTTTVSGGSEDLNIYTLGTAFDTACGTGTVRSSPFCDTGAVSTLMRWANWDTVTNAAKFDTTEASPGAASFVSANFTSSYFNTLSHSLPNSLYYSSTPSWWPSGKAWPPIGPDVSTGNVGRCASGTYSGAQATLSGQCGASLTTSWASHVTSIPAQDCYLVTLGGAPDGTGAALPFDATTCYAGGGTTFSLTVTQPTGGTITGSNCSTNAALASATAVSCSVAPTTGYASCSLSGTGSASSFSGSSGSFSIGANSTVTASCTPYAVTVATGDTRTITEPTFPAVNATIKATKFIALTTAVNVDPFNPTCGSTGGTFGTLGCTGGTSYEPSSSSSSYVAAESLDNTAVNAALASCTSGQTLEFIPGNLGELGFVLAPWSVPNGCRIILDAGIHVFASRNRTDYGGTNCGLVTTGTSSCNHWITSPSTTGSGIYGYGVLDGRGWDAYIGATTQGFYSNRIQAYCNNHGGAIDGSPACTPNASGNNSYGPNGLDLVSANNFTLYKVTVRDSGNFIVNWKGGNGFTAWGAKLIAPFEVSNTDGFDPLNSQNGTFTHGIISNGDNHVAVKSTTSHTHNITFSQNQTGAGIAIAVGTDINASGIANLLVTDNVQRGNLFNSQSAGLQIGSSTKNGGLVDTVTFQNDCMVNEQNSVRLYTNYGGQTGTSTPNYTNILFRNIHVLPSTAPYTTGNSGTYTFQGLSSAPIVAQLDNFVIDGVNQGVASQSGVTHDQYATLYLGPGTVDSSLPPQFSAGTGVTTIGSGGSSTPYACSTSSWKPLVGELNLKTAASNNNQSYSGASASYTLQVVLQPATEISSKESSALTQPVTFLDNGSSIGTAALSGDGTFASLTVSSPAAGSHLYTARYPGDSNYSSFTFGSVVTTISGPVATPAPPTRLTSAVF